ncbi:hypothetical protein [uncultured Nocardioides sp.]|uniref:hypothetical protein n=1 Tax=uncultured Nocardioides sp. TaxID=198441 RepID=UPI0026353F78|nr:hypothetical protein [uncultured Nocardioides sp.]
MTEAEVRRLDEPQVSDWFATLTDAGARELAGLALVVLLADEPTVMPQPYDLHRYARDLSPRWGHLMPDDLTAEDARLAAGWVHEIDKAKAQTDVTVEHLQALAHPGYRPWPRWWPLFPPEDPDAGVEGRCLRGA